MKVNTTPNVARGEAAITIGGVTYPLRFSLNVMRDITALTGHSPAEVGALIGVNYAEIFANLGYCAIKRYVPAAALPADFNVDQAAEMLDDLSAEEADMIGQAISESLNLSNPLLAALKAKGAANMQASQSITTPAESGTSTSTSPSVS